MTCAFYCKNNKMHTSKKKKKMQKMQKKPNMSKNFEPLKNFFTSPWFLVIFYLIKTVPLIFSLLYNQNHKMPLIASSEQRPMLTSGPEIKLICKTLWDIFWLLQ